MTLNPLDLSGKRIVVTGASSGIGRASAILFSRLGAGLVLVGRDEARLESTQQTLYGTGHTSHVFNLAAVDEIPGFLKSVAADGGPLSGLFHAAGTVSLEPVSIIKDKRIEAVFSCNIAAALLLARGFSQKSVRAEGSTSLVFVSSVAGSRGQAGMSIYSASKAALDGAVRSLACELAHRETRVNSIAAGAVMTDMHERITKDLNDESLLEYERKHLLGFGTAEDVAHAGAFLLSDASKWITGTTMVVDGGYCCH